MPCHTRSSEQARQGSTEGKKANSKVKQPYPLARSLRNTTRKKTAASSSVPTLIWPSEELAPVSLVPPVHQASLNFPGMGRPLNYNAGLPTREQFAALEEQYIASLDVRKKQKALISQEMFDNIWLVLHYPKDSTIVTPQFRWWVRKMFSLVRPDQLEGESPRTGPWLLNRERLEFVGEEQDVLAVVVHEGKRVAIREQIYDIICVCHQRIDHGGRDKTGAEIRKTYTWVPKDLIALFVKNCPTCIRKRAGEQVAEESKSVTNNMPAVNSSTWVGDSRTTNSAPQLVALPVNSLVLHSRSGYYIPSDTFAPWAAPSHPAPGHDARLDQGSYESQGIPWRFPSADTVFGGGYYQTPIGAMPPALQQQDFVRLPSINAPGCNGGGDGSMPSHPAKVTLPPLSQVLSGGLTVTGSAPTRVRQPLQALPNINVSPNCVPLQVPPAHAPQLGTTYVPQIDPALFPDGVHMLALAAEVSQERNTGHCGGAGDTARSG